MRQVLLAFAFLVFLMGIGHASTFKDVTQIDDPRGAVWQYDFTYKSGAVSKNLMVTKYACWKQMHNKTVTAGLAAVAYSYTKTVLTITGTSLVGGIFDYDCDGV